MNTVTISPKFQVVTPNRSESLKLEPGQKVQAVEYEHRIELVPVRPATEIRGFLRGIETTVKREDDRVRRRSVRPEADLKSRPAQRNESGEPSNDAAGPKGAWKPNTKRVEVPRDGLDQVGGWCCFSCS